MTLCKGHANFKLNPNMSMSFMVASLPLPAHHPEFAPREGVQDALAHFFRDIEALYVHVYASGWPGVASPFLSQKLQQCAGLQSGDCRSYYVVRLTRRVGILDACSAQGMRPCQAPLVVLVVVYMCI
eukprot:TRINITY_DN7398_c0_g1_i1.p2 TRINITY_DN7398_c0_g1~~TRINITY_DN7398_c0_g1_i1.p2  ORF type:complete len:127 (+),score=13.34 TRINITY_DN7398_c0_g1_i1:344-724(+)